MKQCRRVFPGIAVVLALLLAITPVAQAKKSPLPGPDLTGIELTTEDQIKAQHDLRWAEDLQRAATTPSSSESGVGIQSIPTDGDLRTREYYAAGTGYAQDDQRSGIYFDIKGIFLSLAGLSSWKSVSTLCGILSAALGISISEEKFASAYSYHKYSYWYNDGEYFRGGNWYTGSRSEKQLEYANAWASYNDSVGRPHSDWVIQDQYQPSLDQAGCHYYNTSWLTGWAQYAYDYGQITGETYYTCFPGNPPY